MRRVVVTCVDKRIRADTAWHDPSSPRSMPLHHRRDTFSAPGAAAMLLLQKAWHQPNNQGYIRRLPLFGSYRARAWVWLPPRKQNRHDTTPASYLVSGGKDPVRNKMGEKWASKFSIPWAVWRSECWSSSSSSRRRPFSMPRREEQK